MDTHSRSLDKELDDLKQKLLHMGSLAETMIDQTMGELVQRDESVARDVPRHEEELNRLQSRSTRRRCASWRRSSRWPTTCGSS